MVVSKCFHLSVRYEGITQVQNTSDKLRLPIVLALTYRRHSTEAEGRSSGREAELIQYWVGPCWIDHCNITAGGRARNYPHRTLAERDGYGVWKDEWRDTTCPWAVLVTVGWCCTWWLWDHDYSCCLTGIMTDLLWPLLRSQAWLRLHSSPGKKIIDVYGMM